MAARSSQRRVGTARPKSKGQRWLLRWGWLLPIGAILIGAALLFLTYAFASIPLPQDIELESSAEVYDVNGDQIGTFAGDQTRFLIDARELIREKPFIGQAVVAAEDRDFYEHGGVSLRGIVRAAWANVTGGEVTQGGSTITQQYVKNAVLEDPSRTVTRKVKEAVLAIKMERRFSKREILAFYLNTIYLGRGAYGIEAAARAYFDKHADDLTLSEAAYFAGIIPSPESYQLDENRRGAIERRNQVLDVMVQEGYLNPKRAAATRRQKLRLAPGAQELRSRRQRAAYFMEWLRKEYLYPEYGNDLYTRGLKIYTTLDLEMQGFAEDAVGSILPNPQDPQAALVSVTPRGGVRAFVGGRAFENVGRARGFNFAGDYPGRQAGSAFKPFTLLTAIEEEISPNSTFSGYSPMDIDECAGADGIPPWEVDNYGGQSYGSVSLVTATTNSINTVFAQLIAEVGPEKVAETVEAFEFDREGTNGEREISDSQCSLALGTLDVTPVEMARAFAGFTARGALPPIMPIRYITDSEGNCIKIYRPDVEVECGEEADFDVQPVADRNSADVLNQVMTNVVSGGTAAAADIGRPVAGKTGTTQNNRDAWFAGSIPQLTTVVWMGHPLDKKTGQSPLMQYCSDPALCKPVEGDLGYPIEVTGGSFPARIWEAYMSQAVADFPVEDFPEPEELPDETISSPAPAPPTASPTLVESPSPTPTIIESPSPTPAPTEPAPSPDQSVLPSPTTGREEEDP
jgi:penicillin-binding protein 1A